MRIRYQGIAPSRELNAIVAERLARIARFDTLVSDCQVCLERWYQHHDQGASYRVAIEAALEHREVKLSRESALDAPREALAELLESALASFAHALESIAQDPQRGRHVPPHSEAARRLHALHGIAPDDL